MTEKSDRWIGGGDALLDRPAWMATTEAQDRTENMEMTDFAGDILSGEGGGGQPSGAAEGQDAIAPVVKNFDSAFAALIGQHRQRQDLTRAKVRLELTAQAICRRSLGAKGTFGKGEEDATKTAAASLWSKVRKGTADDPILEAVLMPYMAALEPLEAEIRTKGREMARLVRPMPIWTEWAAGVLGLGEVSLGQLIGEARYPIESYRSHSALWKRFGLAVEMGEIQKLMAYRGGKEAAIAAGYNPQRRSIIHVVGSCLLRLKNDRYSRIYAERKDYEMAREGMSKLRAHNRAMRYMEKRLLRDLWQQSRRIAA